MTRVLVVGCSGVGKSTYAASLAQRLGVRHIELDAVFHGPGWVANPAFAAAVDELTSSGGWVVDGNYTVVRDLLWERADTVVWLDLPRREVMRQVIRRTVRRWVLRVELWNGNRERLRSVFRASHPIRWAWLKHAEYRELYPARFADPAWSHLTCHRFGAHDDAAALLDTAGRQDRQRGG